MDEAGTSGNAKNAVAHTEAGGLQRRVFISYASHDAAVARKVCSALEAAGFPCWIAPRNVVPGTFYADGIVHAIDGSSILVLILSEQAVASAHVGREIERAVSKRHPVVALRIDAAPLTAAFEYFLNQSQWIEGGGSDAAIAQLVSAVGQHLSPGNATSPTNPNQASAVHRKAATPRRAWIIAAAVVAVALAGAYLIVGKAWLPQHETASVVADRSIAVLPFVDMSEKKDQEYFSDGLSEELIDLLTKVPELRVPARTSSFYFKGKQATIADIAKVLGVAFVLEGSVHKSGDKLRVTAQLIKADAGFHVWSETYDRQLTDVFKVQDEIAGAVVKALKVALLAGAPGNGSRTLNPEANDLYMQAMYLSYDLSDGGTARSVDLLYHALALDPRFALAWAMLSRQSAFQAANHLLPERESKAARIEARSAAEKAVALDPSLPEAHLALGRVYLYYDKDIAEATAEYRRALELNPRSSDAMLQLGSAAGQAGQLDERIRLQHQALTMDPLNVNILDVLGNAYLAVGNPAAAERLFRKELDLSPNNLFAKVPC